MNRPIRRSKNRDTQISTYVPHERYLEVREAARAMKMPIAEYMRCVLFGFPLKKKPEDSPQSEG